MSTPSLPTTNAAPGEPTSLKSKALETGASLVQDLAPVKHICAHLNAFHVHAEDHSRVVETNHYCTHLNEDVRQCILYDSPAANARLIGIEYMISPRLFATLPSHERTLWHSHAFEVASGMLIMPKPSSVPEAAWELAETAEMRDVVGWYGKVYHLWQVEKGDQVPLGMPQLMTSFTSEEQWPEFEERVGERDARFGSDWRRKREVREGIERPEVHEDADAAWKKK